MTDALINRLRLATGPDRELDAFLQAEIENRDAFYGHSDHWGPETLLCRYRDQPHDVCVYGARDAARKFCTVNGDGIRHYTSSIDAALTLIPKKFGGSLYLPFGTNSRFPFAIVWKDKKQPSIIEKAATPAIAICIAALKARSRK